MNFEDSNHKEEGKFSNKEEDDYFQATYKIKRLYFSIGNLEF